MNTCSCSLSFLVSFCSCKTKTVWKSLPVLLFFPPTDKTWSYFRCYNLLFNHFTTCGFWAWLWCGLCTDKYSTCGIFNSHLEHLFNTSIFMAEINYIIWVFCLKKNHLKKLAEIPFSSNEKALFPQIEAGNWQLFAQIYVFLLSSLPSPIPWFQNNLQGKKTGHSNVKEKQKLITHFHSWAECFTF